MLYNSNQHIKFDLITSEFISYKNIHFFSNPVLYLKTYMLYVPQKTNIIFMDLRDFKHVPRYNLSKSFFSEVQYTFKTEDT